MTYFLRSVKAKLHPDVHDGVGELAEKSGLGRERIYGLAIAYAIAMPDFEKLLCAFGQGLIFDEPVHSPASEVEKE